MYNGAFGPICIVRKGECCEHQRPLRLGLCLAMVILGIVAAEAHALELKAQAAVLMDASSGSILYEENSEVPCHGQPH